MASDTASPRPSTSQSTTTPYEYTGTPSTSLLRRPSTARPCSGRRSRAASTVGGESQQIICAISEGRGISPTVGMAFVNISTGEAVLSQICDNQFYARTLHKLQVFDPTEILIVSTACPPIARSKMYEVIEENILGAKIINVDRRYWSEATGLDYINQLAFVEDIEAIKVAIDGNYFATCCFCAALKYIDLSKELTFAFHSLRIKYQPSEGSMMIDVSTIQSLELIQNLQNSQSRECLFGLMNQTLSPMGGRLLRLNILQPSTQRDVLKQRYQAVKEFSEMEDMFVQTRLALQGFLDAEKLLTNLIIIPQFPDIHYAEQSINNILMLKTFAQAISPIYMALIGARSALLREIREHCHPDNVFPTLEFIQEVINDDVKYEKTPLELRNQRTYAVKAGVSGLLDVARQTFKEATEDVHQHVTDINHADYEADQFEMRTETRYDSKRRYYLRVYDADFEGRPLPEILVNRFPKKDFIECQTLNLMKLNQRIEDSHSEAVQMSDRTIQNLLHKIRGQIPSLFRVAESIALLDMIAAFNQLATTHEEYNQPEIAKILTIKSGRHPVKDHFNREKFVPNDIYANSQQRFQIVTGYNMSGKSTYIRSIALLSVMAQVGSFVPAAAATFPIVHQLFARVSVDDSIEANVSTFASEMRETAFILRNIEKHSITIIDELGRGTSTRDGLAMALSISEALVNSGSMVWFATHFRELAQIMDQRPGVVNVHFDVDTGDDERFAVRYQVLSGFVEAKHYGLQLARVVNLPPQLLRIAGNVARTLEAGAAAKKSSSKSRAVVKRRKLMLLLKDQLELANSSLSERGPLLGWLRTLQEEFVMRMEKIDHDCAEDDS